MRQSITTIAAVGAGGAIGAVCRYLLSGAIMRNLGFPGFPYGTLAANVIGAFLMGLVVEGVAVRYGLAGPTQSFLTTGILGGFTTFSAFALETGLLYERGQAGLAVAYVGLSVGLCVAALFGGIHLGRAVLA